MPYFIRLGNLSYLSWISNRCWEVLLPGGSLSEVTLDSSARDSPSVCNSVTVRPQDVTNFVPSLSNLEEKKFSDSTETQIKFKRTTETDVARHPW